MPELLAGTTILAQDFPPSVRGTVTTVFDNFSTSSAYAATSTACEITFTANTAGRGRIDIAVRWDSDNANEEVAASCEVRETDGSGTIVHSPDATTGEGVDDTHPTATADFVNRPGWVYLEGLTPGATYWAQLQINTGSGSADISKQILLYTPLP